MAALRKRIFLAKITKYNINWVEQIFFGKRPWFTGHGDTPEEATLNSITPRVAAKCNLVDSKSSSTTQTECSM
jgi:hypothetical protein